MLRLGVIPIINENDTVVTDEIKFGDNDTLGALVANLIEADALIILTDQKGLFTADPRKNPDAKFVTVAQAGDPKLEEMAGGAGSSIGRGGMLTKILAAKRASSSGAHTVIAWGRENDALIRLANGELIGTQLVAPNSHLASPQTMDGRSFANSRKRHSRFRRSPESHPRRKISFADRGNTY